MYDERKKLFKVLLLVWGMIAILFQMIRIVSIHQNQKSNDVHSAIVPYTSLLAQSPVYSECVAVESMIDVEEAWAIEDTRMPAESFLISGMRNGVCELGLDAESQTFYCTLGNDWQFGQPWPQLELYAQPVNQNVPVRVCWMDDYAYDDCADAIQQGYPYELLAYTDTEYAYFNLVFTGLPMVTVHVADGDSIGREYMPARVSVSSAEENHSITEMAGIHTRGNHLHRDKASYRIEFQSLSNKGRLKRKTMNVLGMDADTDWLLISNVQDSTAVRNELSFRLWENWTKEEQTINKLQSRLVEVFVQDEYKGIYQLMQRVDAQKQIEMAGGNSKTDCLFRIGRYDETRPSVELSEEMHLKYVWENNGNVRRGFDLITDFLALNSAEASLDDEHFAEIASERVDVASLMSYYLFIQAAGLTIDNTKNNLYIWVAEDDSQYRYRFAPWDMDYGITKIDYDPDGSVHAYFDTDLILAVRMLDLNVLNCREVFWNMWREKRESVFSDEEIKRWIRSVEDEILRSGAYFRESAKWFGEEQYLYLDALLEFELEQVNTIERVLAERWPIES